MESKIGVSMDISVKYEKIMVRIKICYHVEALIEVQMFY